NANTKRLVSLPVVYLERAMGRVRRCQTGASSRATSRRLATGAARGIFSESDRQYGSSAGVSNRKTQPQGPRAIRAAINRRGGNRDAGWWADYRAVSTDYSLILTL